MRYIVRFDDEAALDPEVVGPKFAGLARAARAGFPVPPAVAVSTAAQAAGAAPEELAAELREVAAEIGLDRGVAVRSSATLEDLGGRSFAGVYETYLDVVGEGAAVERIRECWASASGAVAAGYLEQAGFDGGAPAMAVILQRMVAARAAGVAFSVDPVDPAAGESVVEAVAGLGDRLVSGHVTPWRARVGAGGEVRVDPPAGETAVAAPLGPLDEERWRRVAELARAVAAAFGGPQDVEWAVDGEGRLWLLQARPITTLAEEARAALPGAWTRGIAVDLWADQLTPYLADHMLRNAPRFDFSRMARFVGMPVVQPALGVVDGFLYVNCASLEKLLTMVPRRLRVPDLVALLPPGTDTDALPEPGPGRLLSVALRSLAQGVLFPASNPLLCAWLSRRGLEKLGRELAAIEASSSGDASDSLARARAASETLARLQVRNQWPYFYANVFTVALRALAERRGLDHGRFLELISGGTSNVTAGIERQLRRLAVRLAGDESLAARLGRREALDPEALPEPVRAELDRFLALYGCRSRHRSLTCPRWAESPAEVLGMVSTLVRTPAATEGHDQGATGRRAPAGGGPARGWLLDALRRQSRRYLDLREDLRFFLDKVLFLIRRSLLDLGRRTGLGEGVFFLTDAELQELVDGRLEQETARRRAGERRRRLEAHTEAASFVIDGHPVEPAGGEGDLLAGTGTSPGRKRGRARIVTDPTAAELAEGDILVAANTDPGWTPILSAVHGVVVEEGGLLNHCSIVARELGIPAVVGVRGATRAIPEGATITIDGGAGTVRVEPVADATQ